MHFSQPGPSLPPFMPLQAKRIPYAVPVFMENGLPDPEIVW